MSWPRGKRWRRFCGSDPCCWDWPRTHGNESQLELRRSNCLASGRCRCGWPRTAGSVRGHSLGPAAIPKTAEEVVPRVSRAQDAGLWQPMLAGAEVMKRTGFDRDRDILSEPDDGAPSVRPRSAKTAVRRCLCHRKDSWHMRAAATIVTLCLLVAPGCDNRQRPQQSVSARPAVEREADQLDVL
jgi:hypothetical protein